MKVLLLGGTGTISHAVTRRAIAEGHDVTILNRSWSAYHPAPEGARVVHGDIRSPESVTELVERESFDVAVDFLAFTPEHVAQDVAWFRDKVDQFVFISSASAYLVPVSSATVAALDEDFGSSLLGDKSHSVIFDNSKIKRIAAGWNARIPFAQGAREIIAWHDADASRRTVDADHDWLLGELTRAGLSAPRRSAQLLPATAVAPGPPG